MATRCHRIRQRNDVATLVLNQHHHNRQWASFSAASFRRKLISTVICGGSCSPSCCSSSSSSHPPPTQKPDPNISDIRLSDLLNLSDSPLNSDDEEEEEDEHEDEVERKKRRMEELREAVRKLQSDSNYERGNGAKLIRTMAKVDVDARSILAMMGAIPPLVAMIRVRDDDDDDDDSESQIQALYALLNLGIGNDLNKAAIVEAGVVHNMLEKVKSSDGSLESAVLEPMVANLLALSALDSNKPVIGQSGAIRFLVGFLKDQKCRPQARQDALRALYNLSISPSNVAFFLETDFIPYLVTTLGDVDVSERSIAILSNLVTTSEGRRAISRVPDVFHVLIDVLSWTDSPGCQEKASYVLMVMAHRSFTDRPRMTEAGIESALLELTLLGSALAQRRASRILECLRLMHTSQRQFVNASCPGSAPIYGSSSSAITNVDNLEDERMMSEEKKAVRQLVQQSLNNNLRRIVKRANLPQDFVPSDHLKSLTMSSTSKSLPF